MLGGISLWQVLVAVGIAMIVACLHKTWRAWRTRSRSTAEATSTAETSSDEQTS